MEGGKAVLRGEASREPALGGEGRGEEGCRGGKAECGVVGWGGGGADCGRKREAAEE